jgi:hypothetical protein
MSNKLIFFLIVAIGIAAATFFILEREPQITSDELVKSEIEGYPSQFCTIVFPNIAECVTFSPDDCKDIATPAITACTEDQKATLKSSYSKIDAAEEYKKIGDCFQQNMHDTLMGQYIVPSEECWQKMR